MNQSAQQRHGFATPRAIVLFALVCLFVAGCRKATDLPTAPTESTTTTTLIGRVTDAAGLPLQGVTLAASGKLATTDANGIFALPNATVPSGRAVVIAKKLGYFTSARAAIPTANGITYVRLSLASSAEVGTVDATSGGKVTLSSGASLLIGPNGIATTSGATYTGTVSVSARHLSPSDSNFDQLFAGDLVGQQTDGSQTLLTSAGVIMAELHGANGELLEPAAGHPVTLSVPIDPSQQSIAPATIPLWYFDEALGMWKEEGSATRVGDSYVGTVQHFSSWNCDWKGPWGIIHGRVVCSGVPIPGVVVNTGTSGQQPITNGDGYFTAKVPAGPNTKIEIQVKGSENNQLYHTNSPKTIVASPDLTSELGDFNLDSPCPATLMGKIVDCNNVAIPGLVISSWFGGVVYTYAPQGLFRIPAPPDTLVTLLADVTSGIVVQSDPISTPGPGMSFSADLVACADQATEVRRDILTGFSTRSYAMAFSPDGTKLAVQASNNSDVVVIDIGSGYVVSTLVGAFRNFYGEETRIAWSPDGHTLLTRRTQKYYTNSQTFDCWTLDGTKLTNGEYASAAFFTKDGKAIIGLYDGQVFRYEIATNSKEKIFSIPAYTVRTLVGLSSNPDQFIFVSINNRQSIGVWDMAMDTSVSYVQISTRLYGVDTLCAIVGFQPEPQLTPDKSIFGLIYPSGQYFYSVQTGAVIGGGDGDRVALSADDKSFLYSSYSISTVFLLQLTDAKVLHRFDAPTAFGGATSVALSYDRKLAAALYPYVLRIWNMP